ncbi:hypothetical protein BOX15_Mlig024466g1, partial [Macrostomum lignano]
LTLCAVRLFGGATCRRTLPQLISGMSAASNSAPVHLGNLATRCQLSKQQQCPVRYFCSQQQQQQSSESFWQRIWRTYKTQTKVVLGVHIVGSVIWFTCVYTFVSSSEVNLPQLLQRYLPHRLYSAIPDQAMETLSNPSVGALAAALVLYKLIFPVRDLCTILLTPPTLAALRRLGLIDKLRAEDRLRAITRDKSRETYLKLQRQAKEVRAKAGADRKSGGKR